VQNRVEQRLVNPNAAAVVINVTEHAGSVPASAVLSNHPVNVPNERDIAIIFSDLRILNC
jgi:hypothetical protein